MSPARRSVNPQQEALDLGLPEPAPAKAELNKRAPAKTKPTNTKPAKAEAAQGEPVDSTVVEPARAGSTTRADSATRVRQRKKDAPLLSDEQLRTTAELTVRDLAAYARGEVSRAELSERAAQRASAPYRKALKTLKHSLGPAAHTMTDDAIYELVDIALAARQASQPEAHQPGEPARKAPARKKPAQKKTVQKAPAQKELVQNEPSPQESETAARDIPARPQKVTKASEEVEQEPAPKKSAPEIEAEKSCDQKVCTQKGCSEEDCCPQRKHPASKASTSRTPASKTATPKTPAQEGNACAENYAEPNSSRRRKLPRRRQPLPRRLRLRSPLTSASLPRRLRAVPWRATPPKTASKMRRSKSTCPHPAPRQSPRTWICTPSGKCSSTSRANTCRAASSAPSPNSLRVRTSPSSPAWCT